MWTVDHLEMILVALNCLKFLFKRAIRLESMGYQWVWYGSKPSFAVSIQIAGKMWFLKDGAYQWHTGAAYIFFMFFHVFFSVIHIYCTNLHCVASIRDWIRILRAGLRGCHGDALGFRPGPRRSKGFLKLILLRTYRTSII